jgi:hypothetical protein
MEIFLFYQTKQERSKEIKKRVIYVKGRFPYLCVLPRFGNTLSRLMPLSAPYFENDPPWGFLLYEICTIGGWDKLF